MENPAANEGSLPMSSNFLVDFTAFHVFGLMGGLDFMTAFILATALAMITRHFDMILLHRVLQARIVRKEGEGHRGLPAFRRPEDLEAFHKRHNRGRERK